MSRTYRRTQKGKKSTQGKLKAEDKKLLKELGFDDRPGRMLWVDYLKWKALARERLDYLAGSYSKSPSWWNHDFSTVPRRAKERALCRKIVKGDIDLEEVVFPHSKKPVIYYW